MTLGLVIPAERSTLYSLALCDLSLEKIRAGFEFALRNFAPGYGVNFPSPGQIRQWAEQATAADRQAASTRLLLDRGDKPEGWEAASKEEIAELVAMVRARAASKSMGGSNRAETKPQTEAEYNARIAELQKQRDKLKGDQAGQPSPPLVPPRRSK
jgi:hypothetical protein